MHTWANVAKLTETKARSGGLVARCAAGLPFLLSEGIEVAFVPPVLDAPRRGRVTAVRPLGEGEAAVTFDSVGSIDVAEQLVGCCCLVRRDELSAEDRRALEEAELDLAGFQVWDAAAGFIGMVLCVVDNPAQSLLSVSRAAAPDVPSGAVASDALPEAAAAADSARRTSPEVLIPFVDELVTCIDVEAGRIDVNVPHGLLDL